MRYYQQVQALDVEGAWERVAVPTLIVWGEYDWIMGRDEAERAAAPSCGRAIPRSSPTSCVPAWTTISTSTPIRARRSRKKTERTMRERRALIVEWLRNR